MNIDIEKLRSKGACLSGMEWLESLGTTDSKRIIEIGIKKNRWSDLRWGISRLMTKEQCVEWAIFCAEQVIDIFETKYPDDKRPRQAIEAAKAWLKDPSEETKEAAAAAADAAADAAAGAAYAAADAAAGAADAAAAAADAADDAAGARKETRERCIWKGYEILIGEKPWKQQSATTRHGAKFAD